MIMGKGGRFKTKWNSCLFGGRLQFLFFLLPKTNEIRVYLEDDSNSYFSFLYNFKTIVSSHVQLQNKDEPAKLFQSWLQYFKTIVSSHVHLQNKDEPAKHFFFMTSILFYHFQNNNRNNLSQQEQRMKIINFYHNFFSDVFNNFFYKNSFTKHLFRHLIPAHQHRQTSQKNLPLLLQSSITSQKNLITTTASQSHLSHHCHDIVPRRTYLASPDIHKQIAP